MADPSPQKLRPIPEEKLSPSPSVPPKEEPLHIADELDDLDKESKLQTMLVVGVVLLVIAIGVAVLSYVVRPKPKASGTLSDAYAVALPGDNVLTTIKVTFDNIGGKSLWIKNIKAKLVTADGREYTDTAASAADFDRYFRGFPDLREHSIQPLKLETKVDPGEHARGSVVASFPVPLDTFNSRKSLAVIITPYASYMSPSASEEAPVVITAERH